MNIKLYPLLLLVIGAAHTLQASDNEHTTGATESPRASERTTRQVVDTMEMAPLTEPFTAADCGQALARLKEQNLDLSALVLYQTLGKKDGGYLFTPMTVTNVTYKDMSEEDMHNFPFHREKAFPRDESK